MPQFKLFFEIHMIGCLHTSNNYKIIYTPLSTHRRFLSNFACVAMCVFCLRYLEVCVCERDANAEHTKKCVKLLGAKTTLTHIHLIMVMVLVRREPAKAKPHAQHFGCQAANRQLPGGACLEVYTLGEKKTATNKTASSALFSQNRIVVKHTHIHNHSGASPYSNQPEKCVVCRYNTHQVMLVYLGIAGMYRKDAEIKFKKAPTIRKQLELETYN